MQVDQLLTPFPIKEFHPFPRALMGPGAHGLIGPEALKLGFRKTLIMIRPVTVARAEDKPRLVVLGDVSLTVRTTARSTLQEVHGLQELAHQVRSFAFVSELVEVTDLFSEHPAQHALGLIFGGGVLGTDANSDYGAAFGEFLSEYGTAVTRRTTVLVLGDARGNGNDPNLAAFEEIARRAKEVIW